MSDDLSGILSGWPYDPGQLNVRFIDGDDGERRIQVRLDLGILQMRIDGRPDGHRPFGYDSLLEYHEAQLDEATGGRRSEGGEEAAGGGGRFSLTPEDCQNLRDEAVQYYHRYMALLMLDDFEGVVRDTTRNLRVLDLCGRHAAAEGDRAALEQFRPYIMMMRARARASQAIKDDVPKVALLAIEEGLDALKQHFAAAGEPEGFEQSSEVQMLRGMRDALTPKLPEMPVSQKSELKRRLDQAIEQENYELAAILRDELRQMPD
ncbi:MAG: UvrB/UvrC motif-containing protein [Phycisphaerales bacterium]|nr:UvrB/UvrC motif-containing protein [Phycisphaerales bacterium]